MLIASPVSLKAEQSITTTLDGANIQFDQPPIIKNGGILVPVRVILEAMGVKLSFKEASSIVTMTKGGYYHSCR